FSRLVKRGGKDDAVDLRKHLIASSSAWLEPKPPSEWSDERSPLVLQPLRSAHALRPRWLLMEQVPPALPWSSSIAVALGGPGYQSWVGKVDAADYGTPQHRLRAVLIARLDRAPALPLRTHGGAARPYVTMAEALDWEPGGD